MTVKELFKQVDFDSFWEAFTKHYDIAEYREHTIAKKTFEKLQDIEEKSDGKWVLLFAMSYDEDGESVDGYLLKKEDIENGEDFNGFENIPDELTSEIAREMIEDNYIPQSYAYEFTPWNEILGFEVATLDMDEATCCAIIFYEMTFFGFNDGDCKEEEEKLKKAVEEVESGHFESISAEELFEQLGFKDTRTEEEKEADIVQMYQNSLMTEKSKQRAIRAYLNNKKEPS